VVNFRGRFGDCEADTVEDAKGTGLIATHAERKRRYTKLGKRADKRADTLVASTCAIFRGMPRRCDAPAPSTTAGSSPPSNASRIRWA